MRKEELKSKYPHVYAEVLAEGKAAAMAEGVAVGKTAKIDESMSMGATVFKRQPVTKLTEAEEEVIRIRVKMAALGGLFEYRVRELQEAGISAGKAVRIIAAQYPEAHADFLKRASEGQAGSLIGGTKNV